jgi:hypothetical protein
MHDSLLIGQSGTREPSPLQAGVTHVDDQNHAVLIALNAPTIAQARKDSIAGGLCGVGRP